MMGRPILLRKYAYCPACGHGAGRYKRLPRKRTCKDIYCPRFGQGLVLGEMDDADRLRREWIPKRNELAANDKSPRTQPPARRPAIDGDPSVAGGAPHHQAVPKEDTHTMPTTKKKTAAKAAPKKAPKKADASPVEPLPVNSDGYPEPLSGVRVGGRWNSLPEQHRQQYREAAFAMAEKKTATTRIAARLGVPVVRVRKMLRYMRSKAE